MRILITGGSGFVGAYLCEELRRRGHTIWRPSFYEMDVTKPENVWRYMDSIAIPDALVHLAAQSNVRNSWDSPDNTVAVNTVGTIQIYRAFAAKNPQGIFLFVGSSDEYGIAAQKGVLTEETYCQPQNPYAVSKYAAETILGQLSKVDNTKIICTRSFNHYGPGQKTGFVVSDFASQVAAIKTKKAMPMISVGNLSAKREFVFVTDVIAAYVALLELDVPSGVYNVSGETAYPVREVLDTLVELAEISPRIETDAKRYRPIDVESICGSSKKLKELTGWERKVSLRDGLKRTLDYWLKRYEH